MPICYPCLLMKPPRILFLRSFLYFLFWIHADYCSAVCFGSQAFQVGLWSVWLSGFVLIGLSLYSTQRLPTLKDRIRVTKLDQEAVGDPDNPKITIFSAPSPFNGSVGARQSLAIRSWLALSPQITVVLFSQDPSAVSFAVPFGSRVLVEPNIDFT